MLPGTDMLVCTTVSFAGARLPPGAVSSPQAANVSSAATRPASARCLRRPSDSFCTYTAVPLVMQAGLYPRHTSGANDSHTVSEERLTQSRRALARAARDPTGAGHRHDAGRRPEQLVGLGSPQR